MCLGLVTGEGRGGEGKFAAPLIPCEGTIPSFIFVLQRADRS